ncbi:MAG: hypothetical protein COC15_03805 [Legionellales bacterium]|nr:MAG: hypothetical protein COC15_03805 [Legionellales bacterium]
MWLKLYNRILRLAQHQHASKYLAGMSFIEAIFFPIPPDTMLIPMALARPKEAFKLALITTIASVLGGIVGYCLGMWALDILVLPFINYCNLQEKYQLVQHWFAEKGFKPAVITDLPKAKRDNYNQTRRSSVLIKKLA